MMLTKSEEEIMYLLWTVNEPLTSSEIVARSLDKTWKKSYINLLINSLLGKEMIKVVGVKQMTKNYARTFVPTMTREQYAVREITDRPAFDEAELPEIISELVTKTENAAILKEIESVVKARRAEVK